MSRRIVVALLAGVSTLLTFMILRYFSIELTTLEHWLLLAIIVGLAVLFGAKPAK
ncbi:hypothetical protein [Geomicrobium sp. JCM 19055]|uniref:hypothetical protein n=1 Tax=Geomicrobium sp. JCM 19055 TaxID=1460649 RepID=UPI00045ED579|nr:hypothetical protein [Geomicrobium sp. JCM 19055]GAJ97911.1 hypothetical protein JCM19055_801 [Geomicrobium sp. JCM 19055]